MRVSMHMHGIFDAFTQFFELFFPAFYFARDLPKFRNRHGTVARGFRKVVTVVSSKWVIR